MSPTKLVAALDRRIADSIDDFGPFNRRLIRAQEANMIWPHVAIKALIPVIEEAERIVNTRGADQ